ncbi:MAG: [protein-PII] uridylyltransferase [Legionella sp.]|nr:MAG: [protein-PII] uridylyltransferase [Legionella sp.]PJD99692.1 MAG: [protein-PII] uridylyltransferase [Legionella sp.]
MKSVDFQLKKIIKERKQELSIQLHSGKPIHDITIELVAVVDSLLDDLFKKNRLEQNNAFALIALGSYGRRELQLHSDIDLLLLHDEHALEVDLNRAQQLIQNAWDIGLDISHQITTPEACAQLADTDLCVISTLMDMRLLCGNPALWEELQYKIHPLQMWPTHDYFFAKIKEQEQRHSKYGDTAYYLEPNIKYSPGGLRDLQTLLSISKRHFNINQLAEGVHKGLLTEKELAELIHCQQFLWRIRFALHHLAGKAEERLSFDYQIKLAQFFGYQDLPHSLAIEQFMKDYFKIIKRHRALNEMLLQWFDETIVHEQRQKIIPLDSSFQLSNNYIEAKEKNLFQRHPKSLLALFLWIAQKPEIDGVKSSTIRLIRESLSLINQGFKKNKAHTQLFMAIVNAINPYKALHLMSRYGVLGQYLNCFHLVTGQMQYDLFHIYTVEQHTLFVIRNLYRFQLQEFASEFPLAAQISQRLEKSAILYLSALFHDIAKGRGGDHSDLGAKDAALFAQQHALKPQDEQLLIWLVKNHLLMSQTAQRKDIHDLLTIKQFCTLLPQAHYLDYLYLLTVADICATNPGLWNAWKDSLLKQLYYAATDFMQKQNQLDEAFLIQEKKTKALSLLNKEAFPSESSIHQLWNQFKGTYFLHEAPHAIAHHTKTILTTSSFPLVMIMPHHLEGGIEILIYMPHKDERFAITTTVLANHHLTIQEAMISTCNHQFDLDIYIILNEDSLSFSVSELQKKLVCALTHSATLPKIIPKRLPKSWLHFPAMTQVTFNEHPNNEYTELFLVTNDKPGLLAVISRVFFKLAIHLHKAKIVTAGERAEDSFTITNAKGLALDWEEKEQVKQALKRELAQAH